MFYRQILRHLYFILDLLIIDFPLSRADFLAIGGMIGFVNYVL